MEITTVIPTYIREDGDLQRLDRAIKSVFAQKDSFVNLVISDDTKQRHFKEKLLTQVNAYGRKIHYFEHGNESNASLNTNFGVTKSKTEIVHILHQDDWITNVELYSEATTAISSNEYRWVLSTGVTSGKLNNPKFSPGLVFGFNSIGGPSALIIPKDSWIDLRSEFLMLPDVIQFTQLREKLGDPYITKTPGVEYGTGDHKMTNRISQSQISNDINLLFKERLVNDIPFLYFLTHSNYWGDYYRELTKTIENNPSLPLVVRTKAKFLRLLNRSRTFCIDIKKLLFS